MLCSTNSRKPAPLSTSAPPRLACALPKIPNRILRLAPFRDPLESTPSSDDTMTALADPCQASASGGAADDDDGRAAEGRDADHPRPESGGAAVTAFCRHAGLRGRQAWVSRLAARPRDQEHGRSRRLELEGLCVSHCR